MYTWRASKYFYQFSSQTKDEFAYTYMYYVLFLTLLFCFTTFFWSFFSVVCISSIQTTTTWISIFLSFLQLFSSHFFSVVCIPSIQTTTFTWEAACHNTNFRYFMHLQKTMWVYIISVALCVCLWKVITGLGRTLQCYRLIYQALSKFPLPLDHHWFFGIAHLVSGTCR